MQDDRHIAPFPLEGGRAGDGGGGPSAPRSSRLAPGGVERARRLRREQTVAERILWEALRKLRKNFRRQSPIGPYVADFAHLASRLVIEVDGYHHELPERQWRDAKRDAWLKTEGFRVIRFPERQVRNDLSSVIERIVAETAPPPSPTLPPSRGKGAKRYDVR
jgi:very-short-patch-repair endonuclease